MVIMWLRVLFYFSALFNSKAHKLINYGCVFVVDPIEVYTLSLWWCDLNWTVPNSWKVLICEYRGLGLCAHEWLLLSFYHYWMFKWCCQSMLCDGKSYKFHCILQLKFTPIYDILWAYTHTQRLALQLNTIQHMQTHVQFKCDEQ